MILRAALCALAVLPLSAFAAERVCAPTSMLKAVTELDVPGAPKDHFVRVPKTLYRFGERYGRVEEARNPETGLHLLVVVSEPHIWIADLASRRGNYQKDPGPSYFFRAGIFGDPNIQSGFIKSLEFGCEVAWLSEAGAKRARANHPDLGVVERLTYSEGAEELTLFLQSGFPARLEVRRGGVLYVAIQYLQYSTGLQFNPSLFSRPAGIAFAGEESK